VVRTLVFVTFGFLLTACHGTAVRPEPPHSVADFRTINIGDSCEAVPAREEALASTAVPWQGPKDIYAFRGYDFGRDLLFSYLCPAGDLFAGNYYFPEEQPDGVIGTYHDVHRRLVSLYGKPFADSSDLQADPRFRASESRRYMTTWWTPRLSITMAVMPNFPTEPQGLRVFVVIARRLGGAK